MGGRQASSRARAPRAACRRISSTVHIPLEGMGRQAVRLATPADEDDDAWQASASGPHRLGTHIVIRDSAAPPKPSR